MISSKLKDGAEGRDSNSSLLVNIRPHGLPKKQKKEKNTHVTKEKDRRKLSDVQKSLLSARALGLSFSALKSNQPTRKPSGKETAALFWKVLNTHGSEAHEALKKA
jgi:hypothetical protein